jgi:hypothetical protein
MNKAAIVMILTGALSGGVALAQSPAPSPDKQPSSEQPRDPSSTRGRPDASYPNPSGQDTKTDAAARPHKDKGHDDPSDTAKVKPTPSAGPTGGQDTYNAAAGKKPAPQADCENAKQATKDARTANSGQVNKSEKCVGAQASDDKRDRRATAPPPGATAPMHRK